MTASRNSVDRSFPRSARLLTGADYSQVFKQNKRYSDKYWTILVRRNESGLSRLGLAIAKKRAKRAVDRNRIKRVAREAFREQRPSLSGLELVVMNRDAACHASARDLRDAIDRLLSKMARTAPRHGHLTVPTDN
ncbi:ribonuclease P protein component [Granulosicoccus sp. 3-233]|uniref:ribonuclease P protein component n=1 Tax=Granulosicoccus sp. 3-233 TaxID=3417969 RepID=UPI003D33C33D